MLAQLRRPIVPFRGRTRCGSSRILRNKPRLLAPFCDIWRNSRPYGQSLNVAWHFWKLITASTYNLIESEWTSPRLVVHGPTSLSFLHLFFLSPPLDQDVRKEGYTCYMLVQKLQWSWRIKRNCFVGLPIPILTVIYHRRSRRPYFPDHLKATPRCR